MIAGSLEVKPENKTSRTRKRDHEPNDTETTPPSGESVDQRPPSGSGTTSAVDGTQNTDAVPSDVDDGQSGMAGDSHSDVCQSGSGATELVADCPQDGVSKTAAAEKKCDENDKKTLKMPAENKVDKSEEMPESDKDISDGSVISCEGRIDDDMMIHFDEDVDVDSDTAFHVDNDTAINSDTAINTDTAIKVDGDIAPNVDATTAEEEHATSNDGSCVSDADKRQPSEAECSGDEGSPARDTHVDEAVGVVAEESGNVNGKEDCGHESKAKRRSTSVSIGQLYSSDEGGSDQEKGESVHELAGSGEEGNDDDGSIGKEEMTGSVGSEERTESLADDDEGVATATNDSEPADETKTDCAHYENISEVEDEEQTLEDGEESGEESEGVYDGPGSASMSHIMVPISELPRIPKKRNAEKVR